MQEDKVNLAEMLRYQQSLLNLATQGSTVAPESKGPAVEPARKLEALVRKFRLKAG